MLMRMPTSQSDTQGRKLPAVWLISVLFVSALTLSTAQAQTEIVTTAVRANQSEFIIRDGMDAGFSGRVHVHLAQGVCVGSDQPTDMTIKSLTLFEAVRGRVLDGDQGKVLVNATEAQVKETERAGQLAGSILQAASQNSLGAFGSDRAINWFNASITDAQLQLTAEPVASLLVKPDGTPAAAVLAGCYTTQQLQKLRGLLVTSAQALTTDLQLPRINPR
jgi:hypothetical protein